MSPPDLCIPMNSAQFVVSMSEQLARNESHLTLEFLSEVVAGFQQYSPALKQLCLAYMSPWLPNLSKFVARTEGVTEQEKVVKLIDLLVALTISEEEVSLCVPLCLFVCQSMLIDLLVALTISEEEVNLNE